MAFPIDGRVGHIFANESSVPSEFMRGRVRTDEGEFMFGRAQGDLTTALWCTMATDGTVRSMTGGNVVSGEQVILAIGSVTSANYGWFRANGRNFHGLVHQTVVSADSGVALFFAEDAPAGQMQFTTVGRSAPMATAGSAAAVYFPMLRLITGSASTATSAIFRSASDIYGIAIRDVSSAS